MKNNNTIICFFILLASLYSNAQEFDEVLKITAPERANEMAFGYSADISGNYIIVGSPNDNYDANGSNPLSDAGAAYIFERSTDGTWNNVKKISGSTRGISHYFGYSVAIDGNYAIVGAPYAEVNESGQIRSEAGYVFIFERDGYGNWTEVKKLYASDFDMEDQFGYSVAISGNYTVIGTPGEDEDASGGNTLSGSGSAYIFERNTSEEWIEKQKIVANDRWGEDYFGITAGISGNTAIIGASYEDEDESGGNTMIQAGSAYIFERDATGDWSQVKKIVAPVRSADDQFGCSVTIKNNVVVIGARLEDEDASEGNTLNNSGSAYIYEKNGGTWNFTQKIVASDRDDSDIFGSYIDVWDNYITIGTSYESEDENGNNTYHYSGSTYIFECNQAGEWEEIQKIVASDRYIEDYFGCVAIDGDYIVVGAHGEDEDASGGNTLNSPGSAYIFEACEADNTSDPDNILENGSFETCVLTPWTFYCAWDQGTMGTWQLVDGTCILRPTQLSATPELWHLQLEQILSTAQLSLLEAGETYTLSFDAWGEADNMNCHVFFGEYGGSYTGLLDKNYELNTTAATYTYDFEMTTVYPAMKLALDNGAETTWAAFDNVTLVKKGPSGITDREKSDIIRISPNPASTALNINAKRGSVVRIYSSNGTLLSETELMNNSGKIDIDHLSPGLYFILINIDNEVVLYKQIIE